MKNNSPFIIIFTDLDGTLLDHDTYSWKEAKPALDLCKKKDIPIILVSSKTCAEINVIRKAIELDNPFISENGGGIYFANDTKPKPPPGTVFACDIWKWPIGIPYESLINSLHEIRAELGWEIRGFSDMNPEEISELTGLDIEVSRLAAKRDFDEPFIINEKENFEINRLHKAIENRGLKLSTGGRFFHLHGRYDKGDAIERLVNLYHKDYANIFTVALGDSPNDFPMMKQVHYPVLVRSSQNHHGIDREIPGLKITQEEGPKGWNQAVQEFLMENQKGGIS